MVLFSNNNRYKGFIKVNNQRYFIEAHLKSPPKVEATDVIIDWRLHSLLNDSIFEFIETNCCNTEFIEFFEKLEKFVQSSLKSNEKFDEWTHNPMRTFNLYKCLPQDVNEVEEYVKKIDIEKGIIHIEAIDSALRIHKAVLKLTENYPMEPLQLVNHDLPLDDNNFQKEGLNLYSANTISTFCSRFVAIIECFQDFWNNVAILDDFCWNLDPENPSYKDITRRLKISDRISVKLIFNPFMGWQRPHITFLGCHSTVIEFREILQKNLEKEIWDVNANLMTNLLNLLEIQKFPCKTDFEAEGEDDLNLVQKGECAICFQVVLEGETPTIICDNNNCMTHYHTSCLFKYFTSVPGNKNCFGRILGECPNCEEKIFCPVPHLE